VSERVSEREREGERERERHTHRRCRAIERQKGPAKETKNKKDIFVSLLLRNT